MPELLHLNHHPSAFGAPELFVVGLFVGGEITDQVAFGFAVFAPVGNLHLDDLPHLVGQLGQHFGFLPPEKAGVPQTPVEQVEVACLPRALQEVLFEAAVSAEVVEPSHDLQLLDKVSGAVDRGRAGQEETVFFPLTELVADFRLLGLSRFAPVAFVEDHAAEQTRFPL